MSNTITALGTVPQLLVSATSANLTTSYVALTTFDTHGAEYVGFQLSHTKGGETSLSVSVQVKLIDTDEWVAIPVLSDSVDLVSTATKAIAFQAYVGREVNAMRIRAKIAGTANGTTALQIYGMLSAPTFPIIGSVI